MLQSLARLQSLGPEFVAKIAKPTYPTLAMWTTSRSSIEPKVGIPQSTTTYS